MLRVFAKMHIGNVIGKWGQCIHFLNLFFLIFFESIAKKSWRYRCVIDLNPEEILFEPPDAKDVVTLTELAQRQEKITCEQIVHRDAQSLGSRSKSGGRVATKVVSAKGRIRIGWIAAGREAIVWNKWLGVSHDKLPYTQ